MAQKEKGETKKEEGKRVSERLRERKREIRAKHRERREKHINGDREGVCERQNDTSSRSTRNLTKILTQQCSPEIKPSQNSNNSAGNPIAPRSQSRHSFSPT